MTQSDIKVKLGSNRLFQDVIKRIKSGIWKQCSEAEKAFKQQKNALTIHNGIIFRGVVPFFLPKLRPMVMTKAQETHPGNNATETTVRMMAWWPCISQNVLRYVSKCKECQENRPTLSDIRRGIRLDRSLPCGKCNPTNCEGALESNLCKIWDTKNISFRK